jgi:hypothetical protein
MQMSAKVADVYLFWGSPDPAEMKISLRNHNSRRQPPLRARVRISHNLYNLHKYYQLNLIVQKKVDNCDICTLAEVAFEAATVLVVMFVHSEQQEQELWFPPPPPVQDGTSMPPH